MPRGIKKATEEVVEEGLVETPVEETVVEDLEEEVEETPTEEKKTKKLKGFIVYKLINGKFGYKTGELEMSETLVQVCETEFEAQDLVNKMNSYK